MYLFSGRRVACFSEKHHSFEGSMLAVLGGLNINEKQRRLILSRLFYPIRPLIKKSLFGSFSLTAFTITMDQRRCISGAPEGIRTPDLSLRRGTLYPAELRAQRNYFSTTFGQEKPSSESDGYLWVSSATIVQNAERPPQIVSER